MNYHVWLWTSAPGAESWDTYADGASPEEAVRRACEHAGPYETIREGRVVRYETQGHPCPGCQDCP